METSFLLRKKANEMLVNRSNVNVSGKTTMFVLDSLYIQHNGNFAFEYESLDTFKPYKKGYVYLYKRVCIFWI